MISIGHAAPDVSCEACLLDGRIETVSPAHYYGKWLVLFFWPLDFTFVCPTEIRACSDLGHEFDIAGAVLLGASVDSAHTYRARVRHGLGAVKFPMLCDAAPALARGFGVLADSGWQYAPPSSSIPKAVSSASWRTTSTSATRRAKPSACSVPCKAASSPPANVSPTKRSPPSLERGIHAPATSTPHYPFRTADRQCAPALRRRDRVRRIRRMRPTAPPPQHAAPAAMRIQIRFPQP